MEQGDKNIDKNAANYSRFLPIANIGRIMKKSLPENAKIAKDAKQTVQQCVSQFISFITSEACQKCKNQKRKTINGQDILSSIQVLGFQGYGEILKLYLNKYRQSVKATGEGLQKQQKQQNQDDNSDQQQDQDISNQRE